MDTAKPIKIIVTDDHTLIRTSVRNAMNKYEDIEVIGEAVHGQDLLEKLKYLQPDLIMLNIQMPIMDGLTVLPILRKQYPHIKVIVLSMHNDPSVICKMLELGASSYLTKEAGSEQIYETIIACRHKWFHINETVQNAITKYNPSKTITGNPQFVRNNLTEKEIKILQLLAQCKTPQEIGNTVDLSPRTILAIIDKLKSKAGVKSTAKLLLISAREKIIEG